MTTENEQLAPFRLAIRTEDGWINAYIAKANTMEDAILLSKVRQNLINDPTLAKQWIALMQVLFQAFYEDAMGTTVLRFTDPMPANDQGTEQ